MFERYKKYFDNDRFAKAAGIELIECRPGYAKTQVNVSNNSLNGANVVHGGLLFTLADFAVAVAANTYGKISLTINSDISYFAASSDGVITAEATEISRSNKLATYDVNIINDKNTLLAKARMSVYITPKEIEF